MPNIGDLMIETDPAPDNDDFSENISPFPSVYHQQGSVAMGLEKCSVQHLAQCGGLLCAVSDTDTLCVYQLDTLTRMDTLQPHSVSVTDLATCHTEPHLLITSSKDHTVKVWDLRLTTHTPVHTLRDSTKSHTGPPLTPGKPLCSVALSSAGLVAAGTEQVGSESFILFWDTRAGDKLLGGYWDIHNDDITTLEFHKEKKDILATGSTDGLVNVLDLSQADEDSALVTSLNTEDSVERVAWYTEKENSMNLAIHTHTEGLQLWNTETLTPRTVMDREEVCHGIRRTVSDHTYIAGVHPRQEEEGLVVIAGSRCLSSPCLRLASVRDKKLEPLAMLRRGGVVRCSISLKDGFATGGEDGVIKVWREGLEEESQKTGKLIEKESVRHAPY